MGKRKEISIDETEKLKNSFEGRLLLARIRKDLSQSGLAEKSRINDQTISDYERGKKKPQWDNALQLCAALDCDMNYLAGYISDYQSEKNKLICDTIGLNEKSINLLSEMKESGSDIGEILSYLISNHTNSFRLFLEQYYTYLIARVYKQNQFTYQEGVALAYDKCIQHLQNMADDTIEDASFLESLLDKDVLFRDFIHDKKALKKKSHKKIRE